jgi:hypothetical protein
VTILAEVVSGDTPLTLTLVVLVIGAVGAYVRSQTSMTHRQAALERADEKMLEATEKCAARVTALESDMRVLKATLHPQRSGVYPTLGGDER